MDAFLLTRQWRDTPRGIEVELWAASDAGPLRVRITGQEAVCFLRRADDAGPAAGRRVPLALKTLDGSPVDALYFGHQRDLMHLRERLARGGPPLYESDVKPTERYLMERFITGAFRIHGTPVPRVGYLEFLNPALRGEDVRVDPHLRAMAIDIETSDLEGMLYCIAASGGGLEQVFMLGKPVPAEVPVTFCADERTLLRNFFDWLKAADPDLILGWNVVNFDLDFLERKCRALGEPFSLARGGEAAAVLQPQSETQPRVARVPGRVVLDGIDTLRAAFWSFESFALEAVAGALLGRGKLIRPEEDRLAEIRRLFREDRARLAAYNLEDCRLVNDIFAKADLVRFAVQRARMTGLPMDRQGGSVAAFDHLYLPRLHRHGYVAPDTGARREAAASPGGYVMDSLPGLYDNVLVLDFKSLYPSIIRTFRIDPLGLADPGEDPVPGFLGARFSRSHSILPELVAELWARRDQAKREANKPLSQAVKIIMNAFYGVLGSPGCRFFDPRLASSITRRGHEIITRSRTWIEGHGYRVIYGDTDSLFVLLGEGFDRERSRRVGTELATGLNAWWQQTIELEHRLRSCLEIEFETHYVRFLMPTIRGAAKGSKKRYAGVVADAGEGKGWRLVFKGLESVRTDWTALARDFQRELYRRVFFGEPYEGYVRATVADLRAGRLDHKLIYRKRLRRRLEDYTRSVPPHVQAARKLDKPGRWVEYIVTRSGPEPVQHRPPHPDYDHYLERQLAPVADGILHFINSSFKAVIEGQLEIF